MRRKVERIPAWGLTQAYVLVLFAARMLGDPQTEMAPLLAALVVSGIFLSLLLVRGRQVRAILNILFVIAAIIAIVPLPAALRLAIVLVVPTTLVYLRCDRTRMGKT